MWTVFTFLMAAGGAALAGCASAPSEASFNDRIAAARTDPAAYKKEFDECLQKSGANVSQKQLEAFATLINVPPDQAIRVSCERFVKAVVDGRLTYKQYAAQFRGVVDPEMVRIWQGR